MKKAIMKVLCIVMVLSTLAGCGKSANDANSKYPKEVTKALNTFFNAYEKADVEKLEAIACPDGTSVDKISPLLRSEDGVYYEDYRNFYFYKKLNLPTLTTFVLNCDAFYLQSRENPEEIEKQKQRLDKATVRFEYEILNIMNSKECKTISYGSGLAQIDTDANEYISNSISPNVSDWYVVQADVAWYVDDVKYGWDSKEINALTEQYNLNMNFDQYYKVLDDQLYTFIVYKLDGRWYVYNPLFVNSACSRQIIVDF